MDGLAVPSACRLGPVHDERGIRAPLAHGEAAPDSPWNRYPTVLVLMLADVSCQGTQTSGEVPHSMVPAVNVAGSGWSGVVLRVHVDDELFV